MTTDSHAALANLWRLAGGPADALGRMRLTGDEPALPSSFKTGVLAQATIAASALAAAELWRMHGGTAAEASVDMRHAAAEFRSERYMRVDGGKAADHFGRIAGTYPCRDGRWVRLHANFPHHRDGLLALLGCEDRREAAAEALAGRDAEAFEQEASDRGLVVAMMRTFAEWDAHPQGEAVAGLPAVSIERIGDAPPQPLAPAARPLGGVRVLDLARVLAGPIAGRTLAAHGADVMRIAAPHLPFFESLVIDTGRGKLSAFLDLRQEGDRVRLRALAAEADIFLQAYRPGAIAAHGFAPGHLAELRPGIVCVSLSAYGHEGPWSGKRGFDSLVQTATGFNHAEGAAAGAEGPKALPCQALDHASGYLLAFGAMMALMRRAREGGSWHVRVSLAGTGRFLRDLGRLDGGFDSPDPRLEDVGDLLESSDSPFGRVTAVRHAGRLSGAEPAWQRPAVPLGTHPPRWE